jgi:hypothetical protein
MAEALRNSAPAVAMAQCVGGAHASQLIDAAHRLDPALQADHRVELQQRDGGRRARQVDGSVRDPILDRLRQRIGIDLQPHRQRGRRIDRGGNDLMQSNVSVHFASSPNVSKRKMCLPCAIRFLPWLASAVCRAAAPPSSEPPQPLIAAAKRKTEAVSGVFMGSLFRSSPNKDGQSGGKRPGQLMCRPEARGTRHTRGFQPGWDREFMGSGLAEMPSYLPPLAFVV